MKTKPVSFARSSCDFQKWRQSYNKENCNLECHWKQIKPTTTTIVIVKITITEINDRGRKKKGIN